MPFPALVKSFKRKLTSFESFFWLSNQHEDPFNVSLVIEVNRIYGLNSIKRAAVYLQKKYLILRVNVNRYQSDLFYSERGIGPIPVVHILTKSEKKWLHIASDSIQRPFVDSSLPLIRINVVDKCDNGKQFIIISADHLIADGVSLLIFARDLLKFLSNQNESPVLISQQSFIVSFADQFPSITAKEEKPDPTSLISKNWFPADVNKKEIISKKTLHRPDSDHVSIIFDLFSEDETKQVLEKCRKNGVSLHSLFLASMIRAMHAFYPTLEDKYIKYELPVNLRQYMPDVFEESIGCNIAILSFLEKIDLNSDFNFLVNSIQINIAKELNFKLPRRFINSVDKFIDLQKSHDKLNDLRKWTGPAVGVSNLGKLDDYFFEENSETASLKPLVNLKNFFSCLGIYAVIYTYKNSLNFNFFYPSPTMSKGVTLGIVKKIKENLLGFN